MVRLVVKRGDEVQFIFDTKLETRLDALLLELVYIYNGRLKVFRICNEIEELAKYGPAKMPEMIGLTEEQVEELHLVDEWMDICVPSGGVIENVDLSGRRFGRQPKKEMQNVLLKAVLDAKQMICKEKVVKGDVLVQRTVQEALDILRGSIMIVYPMQLPMHDPIRMELANVEDLRGQQASKEVLEPAKAQLWFAGHHMLPEKRLADYLGSNEKSKVIVKLASSGEGQPSRETISEEDRKQLMLHAYRRQEELKVRKKHDAFTQKLFYC